MVGGGGPIVQCEAGILITTGNFGHDFWCESVFVMNRFEWGRQAIPLLQPAEQASVLDGKPLDLRGVLGLRQSPARLLELYGDRVYIAEGRLELTPQALDKTAIGASQDDLGEQPVQRAAPRRNGGRWGAVRHFAAPPYQPGLLGF